MCNYMQLAIRQDYGRNKYCGSRKKSDKIIGEKI